MPVPVAGHRPVAPAARPMVPVLSLIVPALLAALVLGGFWGYGWYHSRSSPVALGGLAWGDSVIYNRREMRAWLGQHGGSYHRWKRRHPAAYRIITHKAHARHPKK